MDIGFAAPVSGSWATEENLLHIAQRAEQFGYRSLWTFQRLLAPVDHSWGETYRSVQDPIVALAYAAARTENIRLGVAVLNMPFSNPVLMAKQLTTLDILSHGRLEVGLGNGWSDEEYTAVGASKHARGRRGAEFIRLLRTLWTDEVVAHDGEFYRVPPTRMEPKPVQRPHPPILLGGAAEPALRRAGRLCDGWVSSSRADLTTIGQSVAAVRAAAEDAGRDPDALRFVCRGVVRVRPAGAADRRPLTGTLDQIRGDVEALAEQGITEVFVDLNFDPEIGSPDVDPAMSLRRADEVLEALAPKG
ncbi:TIGR03619 family F420-dependent LLM class oxidoreductase [Gandjariella thermophila]|uniref:LLM class F420-dependent oxidoreductase n=1 Tax=Gandjariella thermophila TaxID=1931992 RepID=A0A4D4J704_9PSEU|nr:TIGR03619 family F420-dependent LLM class oxidoreductase [Gandjariella thermophila]GDY30309.1 LLM class F420-dependent oxidoreductase [Gandjariella thermophila]